MEVRALRPGLWRWTARHPAWRPSDDWPHEVGCVYYEAPDAVVLIDPQVPDGDDEERFWRALDRDVERLGRPVVVVLTAPWHRRSSDSIVARYGAMLWSAADPTAPLPTGLQAYPIPPVEEAQVALVVAEHGALVTAEILAGTEAGLTVVPSPSLDDVEALRPALELLAALPTELVLPAHGAPVTEGAQAAVVAAVARALG